MYCIVIVLVLYWIVLDCIGLYWIVLDCIGLYWIEMMVRVHPVLLGKSKHGLDHYGSGALSAHVAKELYR